MGIYFGMIAGHITRIVKPTALAAVGLGTSFLVSPTPSALAEPCPDAQVVFARGTGEPEGIGPTGQAFVDNLRGREAGKSVDVYAVNYPASNEWQTGLDGIRDAGAHVVSMANSCPKTKMVLSGFSQGAAVMGFVTSASVPDGVDPATVPKPLAPEIADHVAAVVLFGTPNVRAMNFLGQPPLVIGPSYVGKTLKVCATDDPVCSDGMNFAAHDTYADGGAYIDKGAAFAASRLDEAAGGPTVVAHAPTGTGFGN
ncbi:MAG: cutinase family protein [Actinomycetota bacterium]|uniref:Cutinase family protein n=1 Tax=Mycobacterium lentiflavum TaxID=141349 RepID=A0ABY3UM32_MYCLN|nr:cutinase family protein [Mycobacterium lentiflavum]MEE3062750.1 cutinase family protein [Actinomycetota bacterium]ULP40660.1 cutinase family protein [Mycobacterium lentiflavum]